MTRRFAVLLLPLALLTVACNGDDDASPTTLATQTSPPLPTTPPELTTVATAPASTEPTRTTAATTTLPDEVTTTSSMATVTTVDGTPVSTQPDEPDWVTIVQGLSDTYDELLMGPDVARIDDLCADGGNPCRSTQGEQIRILAEAEERLIDQPSTPVLSATLEATEDSLPLETARFVVLRVRTIAPDVTATKLVDSSGSVIFDITDAQAGSERLESWTVSRAADGSWRLVILEDLET